MEQATVVHVRRGGPAGEPVVLDPGGTLVFGRSASCDLVLDPDDTGISRTAGEVVSAGTDPVTWFVANLSSSIPFSVVDAYGFRSVLPPGRRAVVDGRLLVHVEGSTTRHTLEVRAGTAAEPDAARAADDGEQATNLAGGVVVNAQDRLALLALFAGYLLEPPRHDPYPRSYQAAAARLGWPRTTLVKRIEYLRERLTAAGVPGLQGPSALTGLAEYVISRRLITPDDLVDLPG
ncbi:FHA domain-containing protein [Angustibacter speluncae]